MDNNLRQEVMINQLIGLSGIDRESARSALIKTNWQFERALSLFLQESSNASGPHQHPQSQLALQTPCNTPATPPQFPEALLAFSKMQMPSVDKSSSTFVKDHRITTKR